MNKISSIFKQDLKFFNNIRKSRTGRYFKFVEFLSFQPQKFKQTSIPDSSSWRSLISNSLSPEFFEVSAQNRLFDCREQNESLIFTEHVNSRSHWEVTFEFVINWNASEFRSRTLNENHAVPPPLLPQLSPLLSNLLATLFSCLFRFSWQLARFYENLLKYQIRSPRSSTIIINNSWNGSGTINKLREIQKSIYLVQSDYIPIVLISVLIGLLISLTIFDSTGKKEY